MPRDPAPTSERPALDRSTFGRRAREPATPEGQLRRWHSPRRPGLTTPAGLDLAPRSPRRTIRVRLAILFFGVFLTSGAALLAINFGVWQGTTGGTIASAVPTSAQDSPASGITQHSSDRHQLLVASATALAIMALASLALGWFVAGRFLRPLRTMTSTTREISATNLHERLNLHGPDDELKELADTFDQLLDRLERSFAFERQFVANASHELRTPLAGMRTSLEVAMAKPVPVPPHIARLTDRLQVELDHVERLLESFLSLAHTQHGPLGDEATVSLSGLSRQAVERRAGAIAAMGLRVSHEGAPNAWVTGSEILVSRLVENLVDNAVSHNEPGGWARITTGAANERALLVVENGGPVLSQDEVKQLTEPFRRIGADRTGSDRGCGLGLAIVSSIVEVEFGSLDIDALAGGGLRVAISLPLALGPPPVQPAPVQPAPVQPAPVQPAPGVPA
jgi:signal transduction histidine kinase